MTNETRFIINHKTIFIKLNSPKFKKREFKILFYINILVCKKNVFLIDKNYNL